MSTMYKRRKAERKLDEEDMAEIALRTLSDGFWIIALLVVMFFVVQN